MRRPSKICSSPIELAERLAPLVAAALALAACATRDAQVGAAPADASTSLFSSELAANGGVWDEFAPLAGERISFGVPAAGARDGLAAELRFPGDPARGPTDDSASSLNVGIGTRAFFRYGTFRARVRFATCAPTEEVVSAVFMYFSDGHDDDGNGVADVHELDLQLLCGTPSFLVLTAWSDYEVQNGAPVFRKASHAVDTATGDLYDTIAPGDATYAKTGHAPELALGGFPAPGAFYEVGIEWASDHVRFFIVSGGAEVTLWTLTDVAFIPQVPLPLMFNVWHSAEHWLPTRGPADYPADDAVMLIDRAEWWAP